MCVYVFVRSCECVGASVFVCLSAFMRSACLLANVLVYVRL